MCRARIQKISVEKNVPAQENTSVQCRKTFFGLKANCLFLPTDRITGIFNKIIYNRCISFGKSVCVGREENDI